MKRAGSAQIPLVKNRLVKDFSKKQLHNFLRPKAHSYQNIQLSSNFSHRQSRKTNPPNYSIEHQIHNQFIQDDQNVSNYKVSDTNEPEQQSITQKMLSNNKSSQKLLYNRTKGQSSYVVRGHDRIYNQASNTSRFKELPKFNEPGVFQQVQMSQTLEDEQEEESLRNQQKMTRDLRRFKYNSNKHSEDFETNKPMRNINIGSKSRDIDQQLQQKVIYENFRTLDSNFLSDQQFTPHGMYAQKKPSNRSIQNINSKKTESNRPLFRDTMNYVDSGNYSQQERFHDDQNHESEVSDQQSQQSSHLDQNDSYKLKYKKYKQKYLNLVDVVKQFQGLNQTLIKDQRQNFIYYEDTISNLQHLLVIKDQEIKNLTHHLMLQKTQTQAKNNQQTSIQGRNLQIQNQRLKNEIDAKEKQINTLKQNIKSINSSSRVTERNRQSMSKNLQKKNDFLKKQKESLTKKISSFQELNRTYEQKLREKQERLIKLFEMNSELQEQNIRLKGRIKSEQTYDTYRTFAPLEKPLNNHLTFSTQTFSKVPFVLSPQKQPSTSEIQKYLACIDQQLHLIRTSVINTKDETNKRGSNPRKKQITDLDLVSESDFQEMIRQSNQKIPYKQLQNVVQKLSSFRASMST